jgi:hypothetical protein
MAEMPHGKRHSWLKRSSAGSEIAEKRVSLAAANGNALA